MSTSANESIDPAPRILCCQNCLEVRQKLLVCSGCRSSHYCSPECQKQHWKKEHKQVCKQRQEQRQQANRILGADLNKEFQTWRQMSRPYLTGLAVQQCGERENAALLVDLNYDPAAKYKYTVESYQAAPWDELQQAMPSLNAGALQLPDLPPGKRCILAVVTANQAAAVMPLSFDKDFEKQVKNNKQKDVYVSGLNTLC